MRVLLTGASGFLGKWVLESLLSRDEVSEVFVVSRSKSSHPDARVCVYKCDLSQPHLVSGLPIAKSDIIVHLSGSYDFDQTYAHNYLGNVVATQNLLAAIHNAPRMIPVVLASTYAVGPHAPDPSSCDPAAELPLTTLPNQSISYAYTKALSEQILWKSEVPVRVMRLGVIVGDSKNGTIEKIDGPYYIMRLMSRIAYLRKLVPRRLNDLTHSWQWMFPVVGRSDALFPVIPVDIAAEAMVAATLAQVRDPVDAIYGTYRSDAISIGEFYQALAKKFLPGAKIIFSENLASLHDYIPYHLLGIPKDALSFALQPRSLCHTNFAAAFGAIEFPKTLSYMDALISGFRFFQGDLICTQSGSES